MLKSPQPYLSARLVINHCHLQSMECTWKKGGMHQNKIPCVSSGQRAATFSLFPSFLLSLTHL